jgi:hypothetical protein
MKQQPKNKAFRNIFFVGFSILFIVVAFVGVTVASITKSAIPPNTDNQKNQAKEQIKNPYEAYTKPVEKIVIHDTVRVYCRKKHCTDPQISHNIETKETGDSIK